MIFEKYFWKCVWYGNDYHKFIQIKQFIESKHVKTISNTINLADRFQRVRVLNDSNDDMLKNMYRYELLVSKKDYEKTLLFLRTIGVTV